MRKYNTRYNEAYEEEVVNHVMGINGHEKCSGKECVKFKKKKIKNNNKKNCDEPMEHEDIKHKRSHDDVEAGSGSDEDNKNNRKKPNHVIDKNENENANPNEKSINRNINDNNQLNNKRLYSYENKIHKGPFSVFVRKVNDKNNKNTWSDVDVAGILRNCKINYKEISRISKNLWDVEFDDYQETNEIIKNGLIKEFGFVAYIPRHKVIQTGVVSNVVSWMDLEELVSAVKEDNKGIKIESAFRIKKKDPKTKKWLDTNSFGINFKGSSLPKKVYISNVRMDIKPYVYKVIRCYKCGRFGHLAKKCYVEDKCLNCGDKNKHQLNKDNKFDKVSKCINCSQNHHCLNLKCSAFLEAKEINLIMASDNISWKLN